MKHFIVLLSVLPLAGCALFQPNQPLNAAAVGPLILDVCDTHDEVIGGTVLVDAERVQALRSTTLLREIVREAQSK